MKQLKKTMTAAVIATVVACGGLYASAASAAKITCANSAGSVWYNVYKNNGQWLGMSKTTYPYYVEVFAQANARKYIVAWYLDGNVYKPSAYSVGGILFPGTMGFRVHGLKTNKTSVVCRLQ